MTNHRNSSSDMRRRGVVLLYTLSVLMIVLSLGFAYTQASFAMARGLGSAAFQQMAYQAALSGHAYATSYIQQLVDARNHGILRYPMETPGCGNGTNNAPVGIEWWAGRERCAQSQCGGPDAQPVAAGGNPPATCSRGGGRMVPVDTWFHFSDVIPPGQTVERYRLWYRLNLNESLTRNGYFYSDERTGIFPCGTAPNQTWVNTVPVQCTPGVGMMMGPFTPCGPCGGGANMAPYPGTNRIQYILTVTGVVEAVSAENGAFAPIAWSQIEAPFHILAGGYMDGAPNTPCQIFRADPAYPGMFRRVEEWEASQTPTMPIMDLHHPQPYIYFKEPMLEVVRDAADRLRATRPTFDAAGRPPAP